MIAMKNSKTQDLTPLIKKILEKNHLDTSLLESLYSSGQINAVYRVGEDYVVKIEKELNVVAHQPELMRLAFEVGVKVPEVLDAGSVDGMDYLLMRQMPGRRVAEDWLDFSDVQKRSFMEQLAGELQKLHSISFSQYAIPRPQEFSSWKEALHVYTDFGGIDPEKLDEKTWKNFEDLKAFYLAHEDLLEPSDPPVLVHNDIHFENILHKDGVITGLLDFDFARQAPKDYELWHIIDFFRYPNYYVDAPLEEKWKSFILTNELPLFSHAYPALFSSPDILTRQRLYLTEDLVSTLRDGATDKFNQKMEAYFYSDWLEKTLGSITNFF